MKVHELMTTLSKCPAGAEVEVYQWDPKTEGSRSWMIEEVKDDNPYQVYKAPIRLTIRERQEDDE